MKQILYNPTYLGKDLMGVLIFKERANPGKIISIKKMILELKCNESNLLFASASKLCNGKNYPVK